MGKLVCWVGCSLGSMVLLLWPSQAAACDVEVSNQIVLMSGGATFTVRMAVDRIEDMPAVMWVNNLTGELVFRRFLGPGAANWDTPEVVDSGSVLVPSDLTGLVGSHMKLWRMFSFAFDSAGEPHVVFVGEETLGDVKLYYVHRIGMQWSVPEALVDLPSPLLDSNDRASYEPWVEADFDADGRLIVTYHCYGNGGHASVPTCDGKIRSLVRQIDGQWSGPHVVFNTAAGMDMAVGPDRVVHVITVQGGTNHHQAIYKSSPDGIDWSAPQTDVTNEPSGDCFAGPVSCWPSVATDREGHPHVAYGLDPDPCCDKTAEPDAGNPDCTWSDRNAPEPDWVQAGGEIKVVRNMGSGWNTGSASLALDDIALHGSLPEIAIDPVNVKYVVGPNYHREMAYDPLTGSWSVLPWESGASRWLFLHAVAAGPGGWVAYPLPNGEAVSHSVAVRRFRRTGSCQTGPVCAQGQTRICGYCGTQTCSASNTWDPCTGEGVCYPEDTDSCGGTGTQTCDYDCTWGPCLGECSPVGSAESCGNCGTKECLTGGTWGQCQNEGECAEGATRPCGTNGTQECGSSCTWGACVEPEEDAGVTEDAQVTPDAASADAASADAASADAADPDATTDQDAGAPDLGVTSGCGCGSVGTDSEDLTTLAGAWLLALFLFLLRRRRCICPSDRSN